MSFLLPVAQVPAQWICKVCQQGENEEIARGDIYEHAGGDGFLHPVHLDCQRGRLTCPSCEKSVSTSLIEFEPQRTASLTTLVWNKVLRNRFLLAGGSAVLSYFVSDPKSQLVCAVVAQCASLSAFGSLEEKNAPLIEPLETLDPGLALSESRRGSTPLDRLERLLNLANLLPATPATSATEATRVAAVYLRRNSLRDRLYREYRWSQVAQTAAVILVWSVMPAQISAISRMLLGL